jgi:hypothetical protein
VKSGVKVSAKDRNVEIGCYFYVDFRWVADQEISGGILDLFLQLLDGTAVVIEFIGQVESVSESFVRINFNKSHSIFIIGDLLQLHDFVVIVDCLLVNAMRKEVYNVLVKVFDVENISQLNIKHLSVFLFRWKLFIH